MQSSRDGISATSPREEIRGNRRMMASKQRDFAANRIEQLNVLIFDLPDDL